MDIKMKHLLILAAMYGFSMADRIKSRFSGLNLDPICLITHCSLQSFYCVRNQGQRLTTLSQNLFTQKLFLGDFWVNKFCQCSQPIRLPFRQMSQRSYQFIGLEIKQNLQFPSQFARILRYSGKAMGLSNNLIAFFVYPLLKISCGHPYQALKMP